MCTVTVIPLPGEGNYRLAFNRDESRSRPIARPPRAEQYGDRQALLPRDPAGGTWIAVNDAGLVIALLNYNPQAPDQAPRDESRWVIRSPRSSRGLVIPLLLTSATADQAIAKAGNVIRPERYAPFRLLILDGHRCATILSDGTRLVADEADWDRKPLMLTSSGLGDAVVEPGRRRLFRETMPGFDGSVQDLIDAQNAFHRHRWQHRPSISVLMSRVDALTVSITTVEANDAGVAMEYVDLQSGPVGRLSLNRGPWSWNTEPSVASLGYW